MAGSQPRDTDLRLADGGDLAKLGPTAELARLFVMFPLSQLFLQAAPLEQLFESPQGGADRLPIVDTHSQRHTADNLLRRAMMRPVNS
jgi:hypothetical protein